MAKKEAKLKTTSEEVKSKMTLEEAKAYRASLYVPQKVKLSETESRNQFKLFWTQNRKRFGKTKI